MKRAGKRDAKAIYNRLVIIYNFGDPVFIIIIIIIIIRSDALPHVGNRADINSTGETSGENGAGISKRDCLKFVFYRRNNSKMLIKLLVIT